MNVMSFVVDAGVVFHEYENKYFVNKLFKY